MWSSSSMLPLWLLVLLIGVRSCWGDGGGGGGSTHSAESELGELLNEQNLQNIGSLVGNFMQSSEHLIEGIKSLDPATLGAMLSFVQQPRENAPDLSPLLSLIGPVLGGSKSWTEVIPMLLQTYNSFMGTEAEQRERQHQDHASFLPPIVEKFHVLFDHFMNSEVGKNLLKSMGGESFIRVFQDENGQFNYTRFVELLENHSFRRHWISTVTKRLSDILIQFSDPALQKRYLVSAQFVLNSFLSSHNYPKSALFDPNRPIETITALVNHAAVKTFNVKISAKTYVKPAVQYLQDLLKLSQNRGLLGVDTHQLSDKLTDTINMEFIEPMARVNRAYRFASKQPECDKYVLCLVNQNQDAEQSSLPGMKPLLSKATSLLMSWFLSSQTGTPFWSYYYYITEEANCQAFYKPACHDFHMEEIKVTTEYVHNEL